MSRTPTITRIDLNPLGGVAGDMFAAALLDAFPEHKPDLLADLERAGLPAGVTAGITAASSSGLRGARFVVTQETAARPPRSFADVQAFVDAGELGRSVRARAVAIFHLLAEAEASVHGTTVDQVHFHEVSDWDSLVDILAAASLIDRLDGARWRIGPLPLGRGSVQTAHGEIPVPAPAALHLLQGFEWVDDGGAGERVTPTGAAILRHLEPGPLGGPARGTLARVGVGCGTRETKGRPNILRALAFSDVKTVPGEDVVERLAFEIDDMTGEEIAVALDHLRATPGVIDVTTSAMTGKKGRPASGFRLMVDPAAAETAVEACFSETSTLGVRLSTARRRVLERRAIDGAEARVKAALRPGGVVTAKAESDDLAATPGLAARRSLAARVTSSAKDTEGEG